MADPGVVGAEVVAPLADAVGLVDRQQRRLDPRHHLDEPGAAEPLGGDVDQVVLARLDLVDPGALLGRVERAVDQRGPDPALRRASTWSFIRAISGLTTSVSPGSSSAGSW